MKKQITERIKVLQEEYQKGQEKLTALEQETKSLQAMMLRISGGIQVLQELLEEEEIAVNNKKRP